MKFFISLLILLSFQAVSSHTFAQGVLGKIKDKVKSRPEKGSDKKDDTKTEESESTDNQPVSENKSSESSSSVTSSGPVPLKVYQNYDFIPGEKIIFEDDFNDDQNGEFPAHWKLSAGQAVLNKVEGKPAFLLTEGNYAVVTPRMKTEKYIAADFTLEFDYIFRTDKDQNVGDGPGVEFYYQEEGYEKNLRTSFGNSEVSIGDFNKTMPEELSKDFLNKWHHAAIILKSGQMKAYVDQYRVCVNPNVDIKPYRIAFDGIGSDAVPIIITHVKLAEGGGMNVIGQKFTEGRIVTHGITFDVNKSVIKAESMGTLNGIAKLLKDNPAVKFEIGGYTDTDGDEAVNKALSQARADAVLKQLVSMGIDPSRLSAKGYGQAKPIADNSTPEGKAANRRVEFVKK